MAARAEDREEAVDRAWERVGMAAAAKKTRLLTYRANVDSFGKSHGCDLCVVCGLHHSPGMASHVHAKLAELPL